MLMLECNILTKLLYMPSLLPQLNPLPLSSEQNLTSHTHSASDYINPSMHTHLYQMLSSSNFLSLHHSARNNSFYLPAFPVSPRHFPPNFGSIGLNSSVMASFDAFSVDSSLCRNHSYGVQSAGVEFHTFDLDRLAQVGNQLADASGEVIRKYFRKTFDILDKEDLSPVTIADQAAEESMVQIIQDNFPSHGIYGEEKGWRCKEDVADYVWVLDPIDGTKSFITGKPLFGTLIALLHKGRPILGIIDQPVLRERWIGLTGRKSTLNGQEVSTRNCSQLSKAYLYTTSPHLFRGDAEVAFTRVRNKVKVPLYGCDCYAYALLASGYVDLVIESGLKPYDFLPLIPVIEGAGGVITDWKGNQLHWEASSNALATSFNVVAAGDKNVHQESLDLLQWH